MASFSRLIVWSMFLLGTPAFLILQGSVTPIARLAGATTLLALLSILMFTGRPTPEIIAPIAAMKAAPAANVVEIKSDLPKPPAPEPHAVTNPQEDTPVDNNTNTEPTEDSAKIAKKYAVSRDAQMEFEDEVEQFVENRRERRTEIRERIARERRMSLASIRNKRLREWASTEDGEGLHELTEGTQHGLQILEYIDDKRVDGASASSLVRIDDRRVVRITRGIAFNSLKSSTDEEATEDDTEYKDPSSDSNLPPPPPDMPPPPPPM